MELTGFLFQPALNKNKLNRRLKKNLKQHEYDKVSHQSKRRKNRRTGKCK